MGDCRIISSEILFCSFIFSHLANTCTFLCISNCFSISSSPSYFIFSLIPYSDSSIICCEDCFLARVLL